MKPPASAVVLAAGLGSRFGTTPKLLAGLDGKPVLQHVLDTLHDAELEPIVVVLGHAIADLRAGIDWRGEIQVVNRHPERGILRSVLLGLRRLAQTWVVPDRTLIVLGDQPRLSAGQIAAVLAAPVDEERPFVMARYDDAYVGNPVLLEAGGRHAVEQLLLNARPSNDRGLSQFFASRPEIVRFVDVPGQNRDVDTPADLAALEVQ